MGKRKLNPTEKKCLNAIKKEGYGDDWTKGTSTYTMAKLVKKGHLKKKLAKVPFTNKEKKTLKKIGYTDSELKKGRRRKRYYLTAKGKKE